MELAEQSSRYAAELAEWMPWSMFALTILLATATPERSDLAVMDLVVEAGLSDGIGKLLNERLAVAVQQTGRFTRILSASDIKAMLDHDAVKSGLGCNESSCLAELGGALGVPYVLASSVGVVGDRLVFNAKLLRVEDALVAARRSDLFASEIALIDGMARAIQELVSAGKIEGLPNDGNTMTNGDRAISGGKWSHKEEEAVLDYWHGLHRRGSGSISDNGSLD